MLRTHATDRPRFEDELEDALVEADVRVLLMVLFHLTGDETWLEAPYRPERDVRLIADREAGLPEEVRAEIRAAVFRLLVAGDVDPAVDTPDDATFLRMMSACLGEPVAPEYVPMMLQEMSLRPDDYPERIRDTVTGVDVTVIGAGVSGLAAAIRLQQSGIRVTVLEKNPDVGGTWLENTYPDCGVDTPNHFYSYSFAPNKEWSAYFSLQPEIRQYLADCAKKFDVYDAIRFGSTVRAARWDDASARWTVTYTDGDGAEQTLTSDYVVPAVGQLNQPAMPSIPGLADFAGTMFHSARWDHSVDLTGLRVGVIGAGASAMQFVPKISASCGSMTIFQRTKQWARPIPEYRQSVTGRLPWLLEHVPFYGAWLRFTLAWRYGDGLHRHLFRDPTWPHPERSLNAGNERHRAELEAYIREELDGRPDLVEKALPSYPPYAKRMLIDNGWYQTLLRDNVELVTERIERVTEAGIVTADGTLHELDVLILATGFKATQFLAGIEVAGHDGHDLREDWGADDARAYLGMTVPEIPNFFMMYGPNTNLAHGGSIVFHAECQVRYIADLIAKTRASGHRSARVRPEVYSGYNERVDAAHRSMVWSHPGVAPWYRNAAGRVVSNSPWRLAEYWAMTEHADLADYVLDEADETAQPLAG
ncbi:flavin-containing monooxygenase [Pseudonocardia sp. RS010]|uniref:flavin-containing monooxygenase n=1 Tax=Pseudonocardia sp. RS010 TaxID=3385979 RepID=UPI0039A2DC23